MQPTVGSARHLLLALWVGFMLGVAVYALIGPYAFAIPESVQVALIALIVGAVGVVGVLSGASITAEATRQVAAASERQASDARADFWAARELDRADARAALFADRVRQLAADLVEAGRQTRQDVARQLNARQRAATVHDYPVPAFEYDPTFGSRARELRFVVRLRTTYDATKALEDALYAVAAFAEPGGGRSTTPTAEDRRAHRTANRAYETAMDAFEAAIQQELGSAQVDARPGAVRLDSTGPSRGRTQSS